MSKSFDWSEWQAGAEEAQFRLKTQTSLPWKVMAFELQYAAQILGERALTGREFDK